MKSNRFLRRLFLVLLTMALLLPAALSAGEEPSANECGDALTWEMDGNGTLTISGTGDMYDYDSASPAPWDAQRDSITAVIIGDGVTRIGEYAFDGCGNLVSVDVPNSVGTIGSFAFQDCRSLRSISLPESVSYIGAAAFQFCWNLSYFKIPSSMSFLEPAVFQQCQGLKSVTIPSHITTIDMSAFYNCYRLEDVFYPGSEEEWNAIEIEADGNGYLLNAEKHFQALSSGSCGTEGDYIVWALYSNGLLDINGTGAMMHYGMGHQAPWRWNANEITEIRVGEGITAIGDWTFRYQMNLTQVYLPSTLTSIGEKGFEGSTALTDIYFNGTQDQWEAIDVSETGNEALGSATVHYAEPSEEEEISELDIPQYLYLTEGAKEISLTLTCSGDVEPDRIDVTVKCGWYRQEEVFTGLQLGDTITFEASAGDYCNLTVTEYKDGYPDLTNTYWSIQVIKGELDAPQATVPASAEAGEPVEIQIEPVANADEYEIHFYQNGGGYSGWTYSQASGTVMMAEVGLDPGEYNVVIRSYAYGYLSGTSENYTLTVTGERPPKPVVTAPSGPVPVNDTGFFTIAADGIQAACRDVHYDNGYLVFQALDGVVSYPVTAEYWEVEYTFRALVGGRWSERSDPYPFAGEEEEWDEPEGPAIQAESTIPCGTDLFVQVSPVPEGVVYCVSLGLVVGHGEESDWYRQLLYDAEFDITEGGVLIPGSSLTEPGEYCVSINVYLNDLGGYLCSSMKKFTVTEGDSALPAAPAVTKLTEQPLCYGTTQFQVTTGGGAEQVYAVVRSEGSDNLEFNPVIVPADPSAESCIVEVQNHWSGTFEIRCSVCRNGVWSVLSDTLEYEVEEIDYYGLEDPELSGPETGILGEQLTFTWEPVENADWYGIQTEFSPEVILPADATSWTFDTSDLKEGQSGRCWVQIFAYGIGRGYSSTYNTLVLLDPALEITAEAVAANEADHTVTLRLQNVTANRIKVRVNGGKDLYYGVQEPGENVLITVPVQSMSDPIEAANYDLDGVHWSPWSSPVSGDMVDGTFPASEYTPVGTVFRLPDALTVIEEEAFAGIPMTEADLPAGVVSIADNAFADTGLIAIYTHNNPCAIEYAQTHGIIALTD